MDLGYLIDSIEKAAFSFEPFKHLYIEEFFRPEDFEQLVALPEIALDAADSDEALVGQLQERGYVPITFPGSTTELSDYLTWHRHRRRGKRHHNEDTCEGYGVTLRFEGTPVSPLLTAVLAFFGGDEWAACLAAKFGVPLEDTHLEQGLQKYLDGYEISPHPDIRKKALTYMVNVNPAPDSESLDYHTHYLRFVPARAYVQEYWKGNPRHDRCWVPWDWCETVKVQRKNNSIVVFSPADDTIHAVKLSYDHLRTQRTQLYGNLWYEDVALEGKPAWRDFEITTAEQPGPLDRPKWSRVVRGLWPAGRN